MLRARHLRPSPISRHILKSNANALQQHQSDITLCRKLLSLLRQCCCKRQVQQIHAQMLLNFALKPNFLLPKIIDFKDYTYASLLFEHIPEPDDYAFNVMIRGLTTTWTLYSLTIMFYYRMKFSGVRPNNFTYPFLFIACANLSELNIGRMGHGMVFKIGLETDDHVCHSMITMYARCWELGSARKVFDEISDRDLVSWNSMISGYSKMGFAKEAVGLFKEMRESGFEPSEMTLVSVLTACGDLGDLSFGTSVESYVVEKKMTLNSYIGSALIDMYGKCGDLLSARKIFDAMTTKDAVTWNAMISGYAQNGASDEAITLFNCMRKAGVTPNTITLIVVLSACASIGALDLGRWVETYASQRGLQDNVYIATALIDMYAKCGSLDNALQIFENMVHKNEVSWNVMISALALHGQAQEALSLFRRMGKDNEGACPNDITFVHVLSACVHAGMVDEGRRLFDLMSASFGLVPKIEHYSCMVDLLARAGHLYEAWDFVEKMPGKPDEVVLGSLLAACQKRKNANISERVIQLLLEVEPSNSGNYVISSKIYANLRKWNESAKMRALMKERGVNKTPGCSWTEIGNQVHEFHAGDDLPHPMAELYELLNEEMKKEGYAPKVDSS
ncbi:hypothetical protein K2173_027247 [Erythroxylum novogranatense]|uniref:Uncharacterized protein n=1 Tax=Erythroxylum novogranatense TaxID=1862640 RepID=A0AAV8U124_9ROSI|nr:hypothetical protein K2173_027247 [Erythroxylum novogranatense]